LEWLQRLMLKGRFGGLPPAWMVACLRLAAVLVYEEEDYEDAFMAYLR
jgi:hypothetical protein